MAVQAASAPSDANGSGHHHQQDLHIAMPGSPTLTNPDMILPDDDFGISYGDDRSQSPLMMWKNAHAAASSTDLTSCSNFSLPSSHLNHSQFIAGPVAPVTPIIYGNGTMLSDIGEVTEVESTIGGASPPRYGARATTQDYSALPAHMREGTDEAAFGSSPTIGLGYVGNVKERAKFAAQQHERRSSIESTSTVTTAMADPANAFADFDDSASADDSVFQGDDEESLASSYVEDQGMLRVPRATERKANGISRDRSEDRNSTISLSQRAEEILANAKRRLTSNLTRARIASPVTSDGSTPSPVLRASTALQREVEFKPGHVRMSSDGTIQNEPSRSQDPQRSASALGAAGGYRKPLSASRSVDQMRDQLHGGYTKPTYKMTTSPSPNGLEPLSEYEDSPPSEPNNLSGGAKLDSFLSPTFGSYTDKGLTRSASTAQMKDLKDQMKGLKGKISSLREQARADSMKRRSLQSLRTPSPFTHSQIDQWYAEPHKQKSPATTDGASSDRNPWNGEVSSAEDDSKANGQHEKEPEASKDEEDSTVSGYTDAEERVTELTHPKQPGAERDVEPVLESVAEENNDGDDGSDMHTEIGSDEDGELGVRSLSQYGDYESESGESLYHDTLSTPPLSHEDREDAFDYEHFFLHSAMGRLHRRDSQGSFSSEDSVETTRGPAARMPTRRGSAGSVSTTDSFATADEGGSDKSVKTSSPELASDTSDHDFSPKAVVPKHMRTRSDSPATARRAAFGIGQGSGRGPTADRKAQGIRRPMSSTATNFHRPSVSSFESTGTTRSFPLISRPKTAAANLSGARGARLGSSPHDSPDAELRTVADALMAETASIFEGRDDQDAGESGSAAMQALVKEDQILVERLVASLGKCVLGLTEVSRASSESRAYRRRIDAARKILEGIEG